MAEIRVTGNSLEYHSLTKIGVMNCQSEYGNYYKMNNETISEHRLRVVIDYDRNFLPAAVMGSGHRSDCKETEGKRM